MKKLSFSLFLVFITFFPAGAQDFFFQNYSTSQGLAGSKVYCIEEDSQHFIWLGTEYGVSRFDGSSFISYTTEEGLSEGGVKCMIEDQFGQLIFGHYEGGISILKDGLVSSLDSLNIKGDIHDLFIDGDILWIATYGSGVFKVSEKNGEWDWYHASQYMGKEGLSDRVFDVLKLSSGEVLFVTDPALKYLDTETEDFKFYKQGVIPAYFQVTSLQESDKGFLYLGTFNGGVYRLNLKNDAITFFDEKKGLSHNFITSVQEDKDGLIWVGTFGGGVNIIKNDEIITVDLNQGILDDFIQAIMVNKEGMVLIATNSNGLQIFKGFQFGSTRKFGDESFSISALTKINSDYYGVTSTGILKFNLNEKAPLAYDQLELFETEQNFKFIKKDKNGLLWLASEFEGVFSFNPQNGELIKIKSLTAYLYINNKITSFEIDDNGNLWIGTINGLLYYNKLTEEVQLLSQEDDLISRDISVVYNLNDTIFVGFRDNRGGINYIIDKQVYRVRIPYVITPTSFLKKGSELWIGTMNHGVFVLENDSIKYRVNSKNGLINDHVQFVQKDLEGGIWIGNNQGINAIRNFESRWVEQYDNEQGVLNEQILRNSTFVDEKNRMWIATSTDMILNNISNRPKSISPSQPLIESIYINDEKVINHELDKLNHTKNDIVFKIASPNLYAPKKTIYHYKIEGYNENWIKLNEEQDINLINLGSGSYSLKLKAIGFDGTELSIDEPLEWTIKPPWYFSIWFIGSVVILIIIVIRVYIHIRERNLKREKEILEERVKERTRLIVLKNKQLAQKNKDVTDSIHYASRIQKAVLPRTTLLDPYGFIYFRPKDIVSGDFYFISYQDDTIYICAADCTGHGVPGALLSIMGRNIMDRIISSFPDILPGEFLDKLNRQVARTLQNDENQTINDGMDLALVKVNISERKLYYAGAYNPLYLIRNGELQEFKADRFSIGSQKIMPGLNYTTKEIDIELKDRIYLFSDGLPDQFGGKKGKKLKTSGLKKYLLSIQDIDVQKQLVKISDHKIDWQGEEEQVDDILLIGFEIDKGILKNSKNG